MLALKKAEFVEVKKWEQAGNTAYTSIVETETLRFSHTSLNTYMYKTTRRHIPEDCAVRRHRREKRKYYLNSLNWLFNDAVSIETNSVGNRWINDYGSARRKPFPASLVHHKSHMSWPGLESGPPRWEDSDWPPELWHVNKDDVLHFFVYKRDRYFR
jgi:hypothetical protein